MFTPLVLMCSMYTMECATYGGPIFETEQECINWIYYIWENEKPPLTREEEMESLANAIWGCTKLDEELGLLKGNRDNLD